MEFYAKNINGTKKIAKKFAKMLKGNEKILLNGDLGAGKTTFTKYLAKALKVKDEVTSPTFTILKQYEGKFKINHFDLYRIEDVSELRELGFDEFMKDDRAIVLIEWAERANLNESEFINVNIEKIDDNKRKFTIIL